MCRNFEGWHVVYIRTEMRKLPGGGGGGIILERKRERQQLLVGCVPQRVGIDVKDDSLVCIGAALIICVSLYGVYL